MEVHPLGRWEVLVVEAEDPKIMVHQEGVVGIQEEGVELMSSKLEGVVVRIVEERVALVSLVVIILTMGL